MKHLHQRIYKAKFLPATSTKGARVKITNLNTNETKIEPYRYEFNGLEEIARYYIEELYTLLTVENTFFDKETLYLICY